MARFNSLRKLVGALVITAAAFGGSMANSASAYGDYCQYKWVVSYEYRTEKYVDWVVEVDDYGCEHKVPVVKYRTIKVPVKKLVKLCYS